MATFLVWVMTSLVVAAVAFGVVVVITGRADLMAEMPRDAVPTGLPGDRPLRPADVDALRFDLAFRGYRMDQVDAALERLTGDLAARDEEIAALRTTQADRDDHA